MPKAKTSDSTPRPDHARMFLRFAALALQDALRADQTTDSDRTLGATMHVERHLISAAFMLRASHEAFGGGLEGLRAAPNQSMMHFVRIARNLHAHAGTAGSISATKIEAKFDVPSDSGVMLGGGHLSVDLDEALPSKEVSRQDLDQARRFSGAHGGDWFQSILAAVQETSVWYGYSPAEIESLKGEALRGIDFELKASGDVFRKIVKGAVEDGTGRRRTESRPGAG